MSTTHVHSQGAHVAQIVKQPRAADSYRAGEPWLLLHNTGRVDRFPSQAEARDEARKTWTAARFTRT